MMKDISALDAETAKNLEISIIGFFEQWKKALVEAFNAVNSLNAMVDSFYREEFEMMDRWENEGGAT